MHTPLQQVYLVSQPTGTIRHTGRDFGASGAVTGALTSTVLSGDRTGWFGCHTWAVPADGADLEACLEPGGPAYARVREVLTDMLASKHTGGGRRPRTLSGAALAGEAERILEHRDYTEFVFAVDGTPVSGVRFNSSPVGADEATALFLVVHDRHLIAIESHNGAGDPHALARESNVGS